MSARLAEAVQGSLFEIRHMPWWRLAGLLVVAILGLSIVLWQLIAPYLFVPADPRDQEIRRLTSALSAARADLEASTKKISAIEAAHASEKKSWQAKEEELKNAKRDFAASDKAAAELETMKRERDQTKLILERKEHELAQHKSTMAAESEKRRSVEEKNSSLAKEIDRLNTLRRTEKGTEDESKKQRDRALTEKEQQRIVAEGAAKKATEERDKAHSKILELEASLAKMSSPAGPGATTAWPWTAPSGSQNSAGNEEKTLPACREICLDTSEPEDVWKATIREGDADLRSPRIRDTDSIWGRCGTVCRFATHENWARHRSAHTLKTYYWRMPSLASANPGGGINTADITGQDRVENCKPGQSYPIVKNNSRQSKLCPEEQGNPKKNKNDAWEFLFKPPPARRQMN